MWISTLLALVFEEIPKIHKFVSSWNYFQGCWGPFKKVISSWDVSPKFYCSNFGVLGHTLRKLVCVNWLKGKLKYGISHHSFWHVEIQFTRREVLKSCFFFFLSIQCLFSTTLSDILWLWLGMLISVPSVLFHNTSVRFCSRAMLFYGYVIWHVIG